MKGKVDSAFGREKSCVRKSGCKLSQGGASKSMQLDQLKVCFHKKKN